MSRDGDQLCGVCRMNLDEEGCCPNPRCPANKYCPRCGSMIGPDLKCADDECRTNRVTINLSERPSSVPYASHPLRKQSFRDLLAVRKRPPKTCGLYRHALEHGSFPAPPSVTCPPASAFDDEEPPTLRVKDSARSESGIRPRVHIAKIGTADVKKAR